MYANKHSISRESPYYILFVLIAAGLYIIALSYISLMKYYSFHATYYDLGQNNEILWLLSHGGVYNYIKSGYTSIYPIQYQKPIIFIVSVIYWFDPTIQFILVLQTALIGISAIPIYLIAKRLISSSFKASIIAILYLTYFPLLDTNIFDFHFSTFGLFFYVLTILAWSYNKKSLMLLPAILTAMVNPLFLLLIVFFLIYVLVSELNEKPKSNMKQILRNNVSILLLCISLLSILLIYNLAGTLFLGGAGSSNGFSFINTLFYAENIKLELFLFLFGSVAFLTLLDPVSLFLLLPYIGYVFYSTDPANYSSFGTFYPIFSVIPIFFGIIRVIAFYEQKNIQESNSSGNVLHHQPPFIRVLTLVSKSIKNDKHFFSFISCMLVFAIIFFPLSPINNDVSGGYYSGNYDIHVLTTMNGNDQFLWSAINIIPQDAAVLTMNDIPQLSGREYIQSYPVSISSKIPYDYMILESNFNYFSQPEKMVKTMNLELSNNSFGIIAEGNGTLVLERGYVGNPQLYVPYSQVFTGYSPGMHYHKMVNGTIIGNIKSSYLWYGPGMTLYPGEYTVSFNMSYIPELNINQTNAYLFTLDIVYGPYHYNIKSVKIFINDFSASANNNNISIAFSLNTILSNVQFRAIDSSGLGTTILKSLYINQNYS